MGVCRRLGVGFAMNLDLRLALVMRISNILNSWIFLLLLCSEEALDKGCFCVETYTGQSSHRVLLIDFSTPSIS
jgi:hypothetical protein